MNFQLQRLLKAHGFSGIYCNPNIGTDIAEIPKMKLKSITSGLYLPSFDIILSRRIIPIIVPRTQKLPTHIP